MGKLITKISNILKSERTKQIENRVKYCLEKAEELYEKNPQRGLRYFNIAVNAYSRLKKGNEELRLMKESLGYSYINKSN